MDDSYRSANSMVLENRTFIDAGLGKGKQLGRLGVSYRLTNLGADEYRRRVVWRALEDRQVLCLLGDKL